MDSEPNKKRWHSDKGSAGQMGYRSPKGSKGKEYASLKLFDFHIYSYCLLLHCGVRLPPFSANI
jgi:hypothetical protein